MYAEPVEEGASDGDAPSGGAYEAVSLGEGDSDSATSYGDHAPPSYLYGYHDTQDDGGSASSSPKTLRKTVPLASDASTTTAPPWQRTYVELAVRCGEGYDDPLALAAMAAHLEDFNYTCERYGRLIIDEMELEPSCKTVKCASLGGIAGGTKFIVAGVLFKVPEDVVVGPGLWLYGGKHGSNEYLANKGAGREFLSCNTLGSILVGDDLTAPLSCLIDYRGRRLLCCALLPIDKTTLVLGSADGGQTVLCDDEQLFHRMLAVGEHLHLARHIVSGTPVVGGGDVEVHRGCDGRGYVLDLARLLPPLAPVKGQPGGMVFCNLFRPEALRLFKAESVCPALSSDAFAGWGTTDPQRREREGDVRAATAHLLSEILPAFVKQLVNVQPTLERFVEFPSRMQAAGLNMRFLARLAIEVQKLEAAVGEHRFNREFAITGWLLCVQSELVARVCKRALRAQLRQCVSHSAQRQVIAAFLTQVRTSAHFWNVTLRELLQLDEWRDCPVAQARDPSSSVSIHLVTYRLVQSMGLQVRRIDAPGADIPQWMTPPVSRVDFQPVLPMDITWSPVVSRLDACSCFTARCLIQRACAVYSDTRVNSAVQQLLRDAVAEVRAYCRRSVMAAQAMLMAHVIYQVLREDKDAELLAYYEVVQLCEFVNDPAFTCVIVAASVVNEVFVGNFRERFEKLMENAKLAAPERIRRHAKLVQELFPKSMATFLLDYAICFGCGGPAETFVAAAARSVGVFSWSRLFWPLADCLKEPNANSEETSRLTLLSNLIHKAVAGHALPELAPEHAYLLGARAPLTQLDEWPAPKSHMRRRSNLLEGTDVDPAIFSWLLADGAPAHVVRNLSVPKSAAAMAMPLVHRLGPHLQSLRVFWSKDLQLSSVGSACPQLRELEVHKSESLTGLASIASLESLVLHNGVVAESDLEIYLLADAQRLARLELSGMRVIGAAGDATLTAACPQSHAALPKRFPYGPGRQWSCDMCGNAPPAPFDPSYHCDPCGYDMCVACVRLSAAAAAPASAPFSCAALRVLVVTRSDVFAPFLRRIVSGAPDLDELDCDKSFDVSTFAPRVCRHVVLPADEKTVVLSTLVATSVRVCNPFSTLKGQSCTATTLVLELDRAATRVAFSSDDFPNLTSLTVKMSDSKCETTIVELPDSLRRLTVQNCSSVLTPQLEWLALDYVSDEQTLPFGMSQLRHLELRSGRSHTHDGLYGALTQLVQSLPVLEHLTVSLAELVLEDLANVVALEKLSSLEINFYVANLNTVSFSRALLGIDPSLSVRKPLRIKPVPFLFVPGRDLLRRHPGIQFESNNDDE